MPTKRKTTARRIVDELHAYTDGQLQRWVPLDTIARRLALIDGEAIEAALVLAVDRDWLLVEGGHSICLTDAGRRLNE